MKTNAIRVTGKVQGVYFRASAMQQAQLLGVNGFVKNEADGSVYLEVEGKSEAVSQMVHWCTSGPALARVKHLDVHEQTTRNFVSFEIKK
jgi:acylphosphatase